MDLEINLHTCCLYRPYQYIKIPLSCDLQILRKKSFLIANWNLKSTFLAILAKILFFGQGIIQILKKDSLGHIQVPYSWAQLSQIFFNWSKTIFFISLSFFAGKRPKMFFFQNNFPNLFIDIILHQKKWQPQESEI